VRAELEQIRQETSTSRFLQTWKPDVRQLVFGCGDGHHGVLVPSSGGESAVARKGIVNSRLPKEIIERRSDNAHVQSGERLFARVESVLREYVHFDDTRIYTLIALWIIGTYQYSIFNYYGYLFLHSIFPRSGKTRMLEVISHLAFESTRPLNAPTPAVIRETAAEGRAVLLDTLERWREKNTESFSAAMELLDAGFRNGSVVQKMVSVNGDWRKESYPVYTPYAMAAINRDSLDETALDRSFVIEMRRKSVKVRKRRYNHFACEADCKPLRDDLYLWALQSAERIASIYDSAELEASVNGLGLNDRAADIWKPLFAIAEAVSLDPQTLGGLRELGTEMGGDPEAIDDLRKLFIVAALRSRVERNAIKGTTEDLMNILREEGIDTGGVNLHALLTSWGFKQMSVRLPQHNAQPRRAWILLDHQLAALDKELSSAA
jgi:hypothetical protein